MSSINDAIHNKSLQQSNVLLRILVRILLKIYPKDLPMVCFVVTQHSESALSLCLRYSKTSCRRQLIIHGSHGENRCLFKILPKILVKISSQRRSIINPSCKATYCCAFSVRILLKILIHKQKRAESPMVSLAQGNTLRKSAF